VSILLIEINASFSNCY